MGFEIGKITNCRMTDENGIQIDFNGITDIEICGEMSGPFSTMKTATISFCVMPNEKNELFTVTIPEKGEENKQVNGTVVYCRFETAKGIFNENTKAYAYYVDAPPEDCLIKEGSVFRVYNWQGMVQYNGARLRCENRTGFLSKEDADLFNGKTLKTIDMVEFEEIGDIISPDKKRVSSFALMNLEEARRLKKLVKTSVPKFGEQEIGINKEIEATQIVFYDRPCCISSIDDFCCTQKTDNNILEENNMNTNMFGNVFKNMKFGKLETNDIKYSMKGIAFKTADGDYVCYNPDFTFTNVANMVIDMPMFAMPVSKEQIKVGDVIDHNGAWVIVSDVTPSEIKVARPWNKEIVSVIPETSIFGFNFYTKVMNPFENFGATATVDNPFGNMLPLMLMSGGDTKNSNDMLMMLALGGGKIDFSNPMMMYMFMGDKSNTNDMLMMMMLSGNNPFEQKHECKCNCKTEIDIEDHWKAVDDYINSIGEVEKDK